MKKEISITENEAQFFLDALVAESGKLMSLAEKCKKKHQEEAEKGIKKSVMAMTPLIQTLSETFNITGANVK